MSDPLMPCPFCGGGETLIEENRLNRAPMMSGKESPVISVEIRHWCPPQQGQPRRNHVVKVGRDMNSAIAAWNTRVTPAEVDALRVREDEREACWNVAINEMLAAEADVETASDEDLVARLQSQGAASAAGRIATFIRARGAA